MAWLSNEVLDNGLQELDNNASRLDICSSEPANYTDATSTLTLGNKSGITVSAPGERGGGGREVQVSAIADGTVSANGTASHIALTNGSNTLYATGALASNQAVTAPNTFTLTAFNIGIPDPA